MDLQVSQSLVVLVKKIVLTLDRLDHDVGVSFLPFRFPCIAGEVDLIFLKLHVSFKGSYEEACGKFYRFSFAISYKFVDLNLAPHVPFLPLGDL